jgi:hypothetical protein
MLTSAILLGCAIAKATSSAFDINFSTTCDTSHVYVEDSSYGQLDGLGPNPLTRVQCLGYSGKGNPSGFLNLTAKWTGFEPFEINGCISSEFWTLTLADNHVVSIDFSTDYRKTNSARLPQLFLMQGNKTFIAEIPNTSTVVNHWIPVSKTLTSADFVQIRPAGGQVGDRDATSHPDFTTTGVSMYFMVGLDVFKTTAGSGGTEKLDYDNINIQVHTVQNP